MRKNDGSVARMQRSVMPDGFPGLRSPSGLRGLQAGQRSAGGRPGRWASRSAV